MINTMASERLEFIILLYLKIVSYGISYALTTILIKEVKERSVTTMVLRTWKKYDEKDDRKNLEKRCKAKKLLVCGVSLNEYNRILTCESAKDIWDFLKTANKGINQVKETKLDMFTTQYEAFTMNESETIQEMHTRFTVIANELHYLGEVISSSK